MAVGVGALGVTAGIGWAVAFGGAPAAADTISPAAARVSSPLELVSLDSVRTGDRLTIRGSVRNPATGSRMEQLETVIFLFDRRGVYVGTTHAAVLQGVLPPGAESRFEVPLATGLQIGRYRVSFRAAAAPVPHVDRRPAPIPAPGRRSRPPLEQRAALAISSAPLP